MTYVVAGVTGNTGSVVAETLLSQNKPVRALVRDRKKASALEQRGAQLVELSLLDVDALTHALTGAEGAYLLLPPIVTSEQTLAEQARVADALATAVERARVPHVVFLSSIAAQLSEGTGPIRSVAYAEQRLRRIAGTRFTFVRAAYFMENYAGSLGALEQGQFQTFIDPARSFPQVATLDIGKLAARSLVEGTRQNQIIELAGPLDGTVADAARTFGEVLGKPLSLQVAPLGAMVDVLSSFGLSRDMAGLYAEMTGSLNEGRLLFEGGHRSERGSTPLAVVARKLLGRG